MKRLLLLLPLLLAVDAGAAHAAEPPSASAWYPIGVGSAPAPTRPAGTLHVSATADSETDRTYLRFGIDSGEVDGVTLTIPLDPDAGTSSPETAAVLACVVTDGFDDGGGGEVPAIDCDGAPTATVTADALTVDVTALVDGDTVEVALVPNGGGTWHLGFAADAPVADVTFAAAAPTSTSTSTPSTTVLAPSPATSALVIPQTELALPPVIEVPAATGAEIADQVEAPAVVAPVRPAGSRGFQYPVVFALPLVLLVIAGLVGHSLTQPVRLEETA